MQEVWKAREKFCESQQLRIGALWRFVQEQRVRRRQARSMAQGGHVLTSYSRQPTLLALDLQGMIMLGCHA